MQEKNFYHFIAGGLVAISIATATESHGAEPTFCETMGDLAESIMTNRQVGVSMSEQMNVTDSDKFATIRGLLRAMIKDAYSEARYNSETVQNIVIEDFRNDVEFACYEKVE